ncbi:FMN-binding protein [Finegoldia dalianensis]|uniref:FMN-binding protein n=1 Tax=Finegoldia dalianensis TaxID=3145239 RepID=A0ABW9KDC4_9FIRM
MERDKLKKYLSFTLATLVTVAMAFSIISYNKKHKINYAINNKTQIASGSNVEGLKDGEYEGNSQGYGGDFKVKIKIKNGELSAINVVTNNETPEYYEKASVIIAQILEKGNTDVDSISGATISSEAIKNAVNDALHKAGSKKEAPKLAEKTQKHNTPNVATKGLKDGVYEASSNGYGGRLSVRVTVKNGKLTNIDVISNNETPSYFNRASSVIDRILSTGSVNVDSVAGATISSNAIKQAVSKALAQAGSKEKAKISKVNPNAKSGKKSIRNLVGKISVGSKQIKDGQYIGAAQGFNGPIKVRVTVKEGSIAKIEILSHHDDNPYFQRASRVISKILGKPGKSVDTVSQATYSSRGIINAVNNALSKAGVAPNISKEKSKNSKEKSSGNKNQEKENNKKPQNNPENNSKTNNSSKINDAKLKDGQYTGVAQGFSGPITVRVTIANGSITNVEILSHSDDAPYFAKAMSVVSRILGKPGKTVDTVSQATYSSRGIINAVNNALSKAGVAPNESNQKPEKENSEQPDNKQPEKEKSNKDKPETDKNDPQKIDDALKKYYNDNPLRDGEYSGWGIGYINTRKTKTYIKVENGEISDIKVGKDSEYGDDMGPFRKKAEKVLSFLKGKEGRLNLAKMGLYREYFEQIRNSKDPKSKVEELFGKQYSTLLNGLSGNNIKTESDLTLLSRAVKAYMSDKYNSKEMFDSISGATVSASGIAQSTREATAKSSNDYKNNSDVKEIKIISPKNKTIEVNKNDAADFSEMKIIVIKKDGSSEKIGWTDFQANGISITDDKGNAITNDLSKYSDTNVIKAKVVHEKSLSYDEFRILIGNYSKDYIVGLEYSVDGIKWYRLENASKDFENTNNIADRQIIDAPTSFEFSKVKIRAVSKNNKRYEYTTSNAAINNTQANYHLVSKDNPNLPSVIFVTFKLSGNESDKKLVEDKEKENPQEKEQETKEEIPVDQKVIDTSLMDSNGQKWIEGKPIRPATVTSLDKDAKIIAKIDGLPQGLSFDGTTITGTPQVSAEGWPEDGSGFKTITLKLKAEKNGKILVRTLTYWLYRDKDRDGISDDDDVDKGEKFTPQRNGAQPIIVNGTRPTIEDFKKKFSNIPQDGSVEVIVEKEPDYTKVSELPQRVNLIFKVKGIKEVGKSYVMVIVKKPVDKKAEQETKQEIPVDQKVIDTSLMDSNGQKWIEGKPIRPATVTSLDKDAKIIAKIDGLPQGLSFDGTTITGTPQVSAEGWPEDGSGFKTITLKLKAEKNGKILVRTLTYWLYRDKDRDGISDDDDLDHGEKFTPQRNGASPIIVNGTKPTIEDFKKKFSNIPQDGSVEVTLEKEPDYTKVGQFRVNIIFKLRKTQEISKSYVFIKIEKPVVEEKDNEKEPVKDSSDKKSEKSQPKNEKNNDKTDLNIDTKTQDEKQKNLENLKEEIR